MKKKKENQKKSDNNLTAMSMVGHLEELRRRILYIVIAVLIGTIASFIFIKDIIIILKAPISNLNIKLYYFKPYEKLTAYFKMAFFIGLIATLPFIIYQISRFIMPALYKKERKFYYFFVVIILLLFSIGAYFCYKVIAPISFKFFTTFMKGDDVLPLWGIKDYFSMLTMLVFFTGIIFQLPLIMMLLARLGLITGEGLVKFRKHAILIIFVVAAIVTPPDVISQILIGVPTLLLYEISIHLAKFMSKKRAKQMREIYENDLNSDENNSYNGNPSDTYDYDPYNEKKI